jgi:phospholipid/cholesterol/gamma-HCH transport system ATP-binding protein
MPTRASQSILSLHGVALAERQHSTRPTCLDLELPRGSLAMIQVDDDADAASLVDICLGLATPAGGQVGFLGVDWQALSPHERLARRRNIGTVVQVHVWPSHLTVLESVLLAHRYHFDEPPEEVVAEATALARLFGLPGLPTGRRDTTPARALARAACVRGFLGAPDLVVVQDQAIEATADLAVPMAQAIAGTRDRGATVLWVTESLSAQATRFVQPDQIFRLGDSGLIRVRRSQ